MNTQLFVRKSIEKKHRKGLLGEDYDCFVEWMQRHGYAHETMRYNVQRVTHFAHYLKRQGVNDICQLVGDNGTKLLSQYKKLWKKQGHWGRNLGLRLFIQSLEASGILPNSELKHKSTFLVIEDYISYLSRQKGLAPNTIRYHKDWMEKFLQSIKHKDEDIAWINLDIAIIDKFICQMGQCQKRSTHKLFIGCLRSFIRFLYQSKIIPEDLSTVITSPRCYKLESLPTVLEWSYVKKLLQCVDQSTTVGLQQYGILIILATYGLRAGEVAGLLLEDIDWKNEKIIVKPGKTRQARCLPLIPEVGTAIINYLKHARPESEFRNIFLITCAPWTPINSSHVGYIVRRNLDLAGIISTTRGPNLLRHSVVTRLIRQGASIKEIGDIYGHQIPESTHVYTKTATENLREVALEVPEVKS